MESDSDVERLFVNERVSEREGLRVTLLLSVRDVESVSDVEAVAERE